MSSVAVGVLPVTLNSQTLSCPTALLAAAAKRVSGRLYVYCHTGSSLQVPPASLEQCLRWATLAYDACSSVDARVDARLLFSATGWDAQAVSRLDFDAVLQSSDVQISGSDIVPQLGGRRVVRLEAADCATPLSDAVPPEAYPWHMLRTRGPRAAMLAVASLILAGPSPPHCRAVVAGTFDRLHAGHRLLLTSASLVCTGTLYVGVAGDLLTARKRYQSLVQPFAVRRAAVTAFLNDVHPGLRIVVGELTNPLRGIDGQPPVDGMVVSRETVSNALRLNVIKMLARILAAVFPPARRALHDKLQGVSPYGLVIVPVIPLRCLDEDKLSSTQLRAKDAAQSTAL